MTRPCLIAIGANLAAPGRNSALDTCEAATRVLHDLACDGTLRRSRWFSSAPVPPSDQPRFVNGVALLHTRQAPETLLAALLAIERRFGRVRSVANAARTLDLDLIDYDGIVIDGSTLTLPHPRAAQRRFVLLPLRDVAPAWRHPVCGLAVDGLLKTLQAEDIVPL